MQTQMVVFYAPKQGNDEREWEDGAAGSCGDAGRNPRFAVADGATEGFGSARWAEQLVAGFVGPDQENGAAEPPTLRPDALHRWLELMQARWHQDPRVAGATDLERLKLARVGSFATLLGCELSGLDGPRARWDAVALGDTVLFHVRNQQVQQFPQIAAEEFGFNPDGVPTKPETLAGMVERLAVAGGDLAVGDRLYLATDALAQWMVAADARDRRSLWTRLATLDHPVTFRKLVADHRRAGEMKNDDVTLMRVHLVATPPAYLVVCR
ncbi:MAG: hypothetical protein ACRDTF_14575 [Pseudonocardiaceae bacterium]